MEDAVGKAAVYPVATLKEAADFLNGEIEIEPSLETLDSVADRGDAVGVAA